MESTRRNPKRKATEITVASSDEPAADLLGKACSPLSSQELEEWPGWIELESEPAFFNIILRDLGVKDVKIQELFTVDQASLDSLSKPVFGLIFLFQYEPGHEEEEQAANGENQVWFANQTTNNACATVALLNIIMNCQEVDLGDRLQNFKESTRHLCTALRGYSISSDSFIRNIHNSFTRRMDHLNSDLCLDNDVSDSKKTGTSKKATSRNRKRKNAALEEYGYHFIAYVPSGGHVWELDGLRTNPLNLGPLESGSWTTIARPQIETRMLQYEDSQLSFNLVALCRCPLLHLSRSIASMVASMDYIRSRMSHSNAFNELISAEEPLMDLDDQAQLAEFKLTPSDIQNADFLDQLKAVASSRSWEVKDAYELYQQFYSEAKTAMGEFRAEIIAMEEDERRVKGRKRDYGSALNSWVTKLAEKGVLEDIIKMSS